MINAQQLLEMVDGKRVEEILDIPDDVLFAVDINTPVNDEFLLHKAVETRNLGLVVKLLKHPKINLNVKTPVLHASAAHLAATLPDAAILTALVVAGININQPDVNKAPPLEVAVMHGTADHITALCQGELNMAANFSTGGPALKKAAEVVAATQAALLQHQAQPNPDGNFDRIREQALKVQYHRAQRILQILLCNGAAIGRSVPGLPDAFSLDKLFAHHKELQATGEPNNVPYRQIVLRCEELRATLSEDKFKLLLPLQRMAKMSLPGEVTLKGLCLEIIARNPALRGSCQAKLVDLSDALAKIPTHEGLYTGIGIRIARYEARIRELNQLAQNLSTPAYSYLARAARREGTHQQQFNAGLYIFLPALSLVLLAMIGFILPWFDMCPEGLPRTEFYCQIMKNQGWNALTAALLTILVHRNIDLFPHLFVNIGDAYTLLQETETRYLKEDRESNALNPPVHIVNRSTVTAKGAIRQLISDYQAEVQAARETYHPRVLNTYAFFQSAESEVADLRVLESKASPN
jgi:hypothetical protein